MNLGQSAFSWQQNLKHNACAAARWAMERFESDYSEDFEEEELSSAALPSAGSLSVRRRHGGRGPDRGVERAGQSEVSKLGEDRYTTLRRQQALKRQPITTSKSTGKPNVFFS